jgi:hypothetical protein
VVLDWAPGFLLQTSTNAFGPFLPLPDATSPHTNPFGGDAQRFFRLAK